MHGVGEMSGEHKHGVTGLALVDSVLFSGGVDGALLAWDAGMGRADYRCKSM